MYDGNGKLFTQLYWKSFVVETLSVRVDTDKLLKLFDI